jgi:hypothetical protein
VGRGAEGRRLAEKLGAVRDGYGTGLLHTAALGGSLPVCRYLVEDLLLDVNDVGPGGARATFNPSPFLAFTLSPGKKPVFIHAQNNPNFI